MLIFGLLAYYILVKGGSFMARIKHTSSEVTLLARLMKAEALGEGKFGMLLVGNVGVNRVIATCGLHKSVSSIKQMVYQQPGGFAGVNTPLFNEPVTKMQKDLAHKTIVFWRADPANYALYFRNPGQGNPCGDYFFGPFVGRYKNHCYYNPDPEENCGL
jgi:N-acetylmuramoyl-L-alanine amidase